MKRNKEKQKAKKKLLWRDLLKRKIEEEVNKLPKQRPVSHSRSAAS